MAGIIGPACKSPGEAAAAASAIAGMQGAPKGMKAKVTVTSVNPVGELFAASVAVEYVHDPNAAEPATAEATQTDDGKTEGEGDASKTSEAKDSHSLTAAQERGLDASIPDTSIIQSMEQLPDPNQDLLKAEVPSAGGPQSAEAVDMAEQMKTEFNDQPDDLLVINNSSTTPAQAASNEAHNQRELDAEETRREQAEANAANAQKEALTPEPLT